MNKIYDKMFLKNENQIKYQQLIHINNMIRRNKVWYHSNRYQYFKKKENKILNSKKIINE